MTFKVTSGHAQVLHGSDNICRLQVPPPDKFISVQSTSAYNPTCCSLCARLVVLCGLMLLLRWLSVDVLSEQESEAEERQEREWTLNEEVREFETKIWKNFKQ